MDGYNFLRLTRNFPGRANICRTEVLVPSDEVVYHKFVITDDDIVSEIGLGLNNYLMINISVQLIR